MPFYKRFYEISFDLMCVMTPTHLVEVNDVFVMKTGFSETVLRARPFLEFVYPDDQEMVRERLLRFVNGAIGGFECRLVTASKKILWLSWRVHVDVDFDREESFMHAVAKDITEQKVIENQLGHYVVNLQRAKEEAESLAYVTSHDLQEPLRTIENWATFLKEDYGSSIPAEAHENIDHILTNARRGRELVNDLLSLSRVGRVLEFGWVDTNKAVNSAVLDLEFVVRDSQAEISVVGPLPRAWGDASMFRLLVKNLLSNAIKFANSTPKIEIWATEDLGAWTFHVQDHGPGIDQAYGTRVFEVFSRLSTTTPGTGIGLAICKKIASLHGGRIWFDSTEGGGATFHFTVAKPVTPSDEDAPHTGGGGSPAGLPARSTSTGEDVGSPPVAPRLGRLTGAAVLASNGRLRDRPSLRPRTTRPEPTEGERIRAAGGGKIR